MLYRVAREAIAKCLQNMRGVTAAAQLRKPTHTVLSIEDDGCAGSIQRVERRIIRPATHA